MSKLLKSKYNSTGDRCVDACLSYGELRYLDCEGLAINIEVPYDKYEEAINDFTERRKEGLITNNIDPSTVLKKGSFTYNQVKNIVNLNKIKGLRVFEIDGSIELEHTLGISGSIEYALSIWNGDRKEEALEKAIIRAIKIHGLKFVKSLKLDEKYEVVNDKIAKLGNLEGYQLYTMESCKIQDDIYSNIVDNRINLKKGLYIVIGSIGSLIGFILVQALTNFGKNLNNIFFYIEITIAVMALFYILTIRIVKLISYNYMKKSSGYIIDMFDDELEYYSYNNLLTENEKNVIVQNITNGEISKLIVEIKGSVNKKISINKFISKETKLILESRCSVFLPSDKEIIEGTENLIKKYFNQVNV